MILLNNTMLYFKKEGELILYIFSEESVKKLSNEYTIESIDWMIHHLTRRMKTNYNAFIEDFILTHQILKKAICLEYVSQFESLSVFNQGQLFLQILEELKHHLFFNE